MAVLEILIYPDPVLRQRCKEVTEVGPEIAKLMDDMAETMYAAPGIGLAAAQVGSPHRVIVVDIGEDPETEHPSGLFKMANPVIRRVEGTIDMEEGCLSIPDIRAVVRRPSYVKVEYLDERGEKKSLEATGLLAVCLQHEIDHLDGILFVDRLSSARREMVRGKLRKLARKKKRG